MRSATAIIRVAFLLQVYAKKLSANHFGEVQDSIDKLVDRTVDKFLDRVLKTSPLGGAKLGRTTLSKPDHFRISHHTTLGPLPPPPIWFSSAQVKDWYLRLNPFPSNSDRYTLPPRPCPSHAARYSLMSDVALSSLSRRDALVASVCGATALVSLPAIAKNAESYDATALVGKKYEAETLYKDFARAPSGLLFKDIKPGNGKMPTTGDRCVIDWTGYTIGYDGRPFETKKRTEVEGGDDSFPRFELGKGSIIPAIEEAVMGMSEGGIRQLIVDQPALSYPAGDPSHDRVGPKPSTFGGQRALNSVLETPNRDKTLLFNIKLFRVDKPGQNGWNAR